MIANKLPTVKGLNNVFNSIGWADYTCNPVTGCERVSDGCKHCYAHGVHARFNNGVPFSRIQFHPERLDAPLKLKRPSIIFVGSMTDMFHKDVPFEAVRDIINVISQVPQHTFMLLSKRPERMAEFFKLANEYYQVEKPLSNLHLGVTAENQEMADARIPVLLSIPAAGHFISAEPMLGAIQIPDKYLKCKGITVCDELKCGGGPQSRGEESWCAPDNCPPRIDLVICGKENGSGSRECKPEWVIDLYDQTRSAGVKFYAKNGMPEGVPEHIKNCKEKIA
jgi:protein gp37